MPVNAVAYRALTIWLKLTGDRCRVSQLVEDSALDWSEQGSMTAICC